MNSSETLRRGIPGPDEAPLQCRMSKFQASAEPAGAGSARTAPSRRTVSAPVSLSVFQPDSKNPAGACERGTT